MENNKDLTNSENILVKVDQNNLIFIDPNSVIDPDGQIQPRGVKQENLVMYVNLEADLVPRTTLISDNDRGNTLTQIAKGNLNFLKNQTGDGNFDTSWTDSFIPKPKESENSDTLNGKDLSFSQGQFTDPSAQTFGIESISIVVKGANFVPQVNINFVDVRGKTLFESGNNSPYNAFFHIPWPIFYLTVKGYYGKAIRYRLHLVKFSSKFNDSNGNFEISTSFVGSTYAYLNDIPLSAVINAPYMYVNEVNEDKEFDEKRGLYVKKATQSSKGYSILKSVYQQYKQKGLIPNDFPVKTLMDLGYIAQTLDKILEQQVFSSVDMGVFKGVKDLDTALNGFENETKAWAKKNLSNTEYAVVNKNGSTTNEIEPDELNKWYFLNGSSDKRTSFDKITGTTKTGTLEFLLENNKTKINNAVNFLKEYKKTSDANFTKLSVSTIKDINEYVTNKTTGKFVAVGINQLFADIFEIRKSFEEQNRKLEDAVEKRMNEIIRSPNALGFEPTIRNIFAVLLANAEVYIRLMKDVHNRAFEKSKERVKLIGNLSKESKGESIYPWPEVKKPVSAGKQNVIAYPGEPELLSKLKSTNKNLWPEVDFVETYVDTVTNKIETNVKDEPTRNEVTYVFETNGDFNAVEDLSTMDLLTNSLPYIDKSYAGFVYEIYERAKYVTLFDSFSNDFLIALANEEFKNIEQIIKEDIDLVDFVKNITSVNSLINTTYTSTELDNGKVTSNVTYGGYLYSLSPYERFSYFKDNLPTVDYIRSIIDEPFKFEPYQFTNLDKLTKKGDLGDSEEKFNNELLKYEPENYRMKIYPFSSNTYLNYIGKESFTRDNFKFNGIFKINTSEGFITTPVKTTSWVKNGYTDNMFTQNMTIGKSSVNVLNTPFFHNQLFSDFTKTSTYGKYTGSAYLLLNSLPFIDLDETITFDDKSILTSSIFREISGTHFVPYHLILKWGSIYHRYKRYITEGVDILNGCLNTNDITQPITGSTFFDNDSGLTFTVLTRTGTTTGSTESVTYSNKNNVGLNPFYHAIFNQVVNGYNHYNTSLGNLSYSSQTITNKIIHRVRQENQRNHWSVFIDNSQYVSGDDNYTLLPSNNLGTLTRGESFDVSEQNNFKTLWWTNDTTTDTLSGYTFSSYKDYLRSTGNTFSLTTNYKKVIDLIGTFSPKILDTFESYFLDFASQTSNNEVNYQVFNGTVYDKFQDLLKDLCVVPKGNDPSDIELLINNLKTKQKTNAEFVTSFLLSNSNLIKFTLANPKELDAYILYGMGNYGDLTTYGVEPFSISDVNTQTQNLIELYIGEDIDGHYLNFFGVNDIKLTEENIINYRPIALIYAGYVNAGNTNTKTAFSDYLRNEIIARSVNTTSTEGVKVPQAGSDIRLINYLNILLPKLSTIRVANDTFVDRKYRGYNTSDTKLELYNTFKSFNDKWTAGNSIGQRLLLEEFLFLDKANKDIGDNFYLNIDRIKPLLDPKNSKTNLYGAISMLIQGTELDMRALPAYVNFYGTPMTNNRSRITPSKNVAKNIFGTFLDVDYQESTPKIIIQYVGGASKRPDMSDSRAYKFNDDGFNIGSINNNPIVITSLTDFNNVDLTKSNRAVAFEVSFGDQNQGIFKGLQLDQASLKNTSESFVVMENLARSSSGAGAYNVDVGLFDLYKTQSYKCDVTSMGNVMIQPTMFFYLKNIPMFRGTYWITEVSHNIRGNNITTSFTGTRIPFTSLPDPKDSFVSSYRVLFDKIAAKAVALFKQREEDRKTNTTEPIEYDGVTFITDRGPESNRITGEEITKTSPKVGITEFGLPYNGYEEERLIQKIDNPNYGGTWLRAVVAKINGKNYKIEDDKTMNIVNNLTWSQLNPKTNKFYSTRFRVSQKYSAEKIRTATTTFLNPLNKKQVVLTPNYQLDPTLGNILTQGPVSSGPDSKEYGITMSESLMSELGLFDGNVVYFRMNS